MPYSSARAVGIGEGSGVAVTCGEGSEAVAEGGTLGKLYCDSPFHW
jgi:hypothetical protein